MDGYRNLGVSVCLLAAFTASAPGDVQFTTHQVPVDTSAASALASDGTNLFYFQSGFWGDERGNLFTSVTGETGTWMQLDSVVDDLPGTKPGEIYGQCMAYHPYYNVLVVSRWEDPSLGGEYSWDNARIVIYDLSFDEWILLDEGSPAELTGGFTEIDNIVYGIQHAGGSPFRRFDLDTASVDEGTTISGLSGDDPTWISRVSKLTTADGMIYGIKNDWNTEPAGTGDRLFMIDPADWAAGGSSTPAVDLGVLPFEVGAGSSIVAVGPEWSAGGSGALFIIAGQSPSDHEGNWYSGDNRSDQYAIYDLANGTFEIGQLPGVTGRGGCAAYHDGKLYIKRGLDEWGYYNNTLWIAEPGEIQPTIDISVGFIERTPRYDYDAVPNQPSPGDTVTFHGHITNRSDIMVPVFNYEWRIDGSVVATDTLSNMAVNEERVVTLNWIWQDGDHTVSLIADPDDSLDEFSEINNTITDRTNGIIVGFWVEESVYLYFRQYQKDLGEGVGSNCWENWAQRQMGAWNTFCEEAVYPLSPQGVLDRVRIDKIIVVEDGALPLGPWGLPTNNPDVTDKTVDMMWGFTADSLSTPFYSDHTTVSDSNPFYHERSLLHELGHARYLIDNYGFDAHDGQVFIEEDGQPIAGSEYMPFIAYDSVLYYNKSGGIMTGPYEGWSPYEAAALNLIAGQRAVCGNYNAPCNIGVFLQDLPANNHMQILDRYGQPRAGADVRIYQAEPQAGVWYGKTFDNTADMMLTADASGYVELGTNPFDDDPIEHTYGHSSGDIILRIEHDSQVWYRFFEVTEFNMQYWAGNTTDAYYSITVEGNERLSCDFDDDGDVDLDDYVHLNDCLAGPLASPASGCEDADVDSSNAVDLYDITIFQDQFTGP